MAAPWLTGEARRENTKAKLLPPSLGTGMQGGKPEHLFPQGGEVLVSPSLLTCFIFQDIKEAPSVSSLKFLHTVVSAGSNVSLIFVFPPFSHHLKCRVSLL